METRKSVQVLIAEDDVLVSEMVQGLLAECGFAVVGTATNGQIAVDMTRILKPDIVMMDIALPVIDGLTATLQIQETCPTPVVVLTAYETSELVRRASAVGVGAYLVKPPHVQEVERAITIAMARFGDMTQLRQLNAALEARKKELEEAYSKVKTLTGLLPICANCKKIRNDQGYWQRLERFFQEHSDIMFSHGLCPDCFESYKSMINSKNT